MAASDKTTNVYSEKFSYTAKDMIWKDHVSKIEKAQRVYDHKWGFLHGQQPPIPPDIHRRSIGALNSPLHARSSSMMIDHDKQESGEIQTVSSSPRPIPVTSNRLIGWRAADQSCTLEKYGRYARGQESLHKKFKWPIEGFD